METTNQNKVLKRAIVLCWIALAFCFIIKICGGNFFAIAVENKRFIAVCRFVDANTWLLKILLYLNYLVVCSFYFKATFRQTKFTGKQAVILVPIFTILYFVKMLNMYVGAILEILFMFLLPIIFKKCKWYLSLLYLLVYNILGYVSVFIKEISNFIVPDYSLVGLIFSLDIYFMLILFMLYNKKES